MNTNQQKTYDNNQLDVSFDPWLLYPPNPHPKKSSKLYINEVIPGFPDDGMSAIIDDFVWTSLPNPHLPIEVSKTTTSNWFPGTCQREFSVSHSIEFVTGGKAEWIINDEKFDLKKNDICIRNPNHNYSCKALPPDRFIKKVLFLGGGGCDQIFRLSGLDKISKVRFSKEDAEYVHDLMIQIEELNREKKRNFTMKISALTYEIILMLSNEVYGHSNVRDVPEYLIKAVNFALKNLDKNLHINDLAKAASCCESYLTKIFRQYLKINPHKWLEEQKMRYAAFQLQLSRKKIYEISDELGYSDPFHFTKVFKRVKGISPSVFRKKSRE